MGQDPPVTGLVRRFEAEERKVFGGCLGCQPGAKGWVHGVAAVQLRSVVPGQGVKVQFPGAVGPKQLGGRIEEGEGLPLDAAPAGVLTGDAEGTPSPVLGPVEAGGVDQRDCRPRPGD